MGSGVRARFLPSPALLHGGWDVGCCRIGLAASAGFGEPELTCPCRPGQAPAGRRIPPTFSAASRPAPGDARGEAPCIKITLVSPFPTGEGGWGIGGKKANQRQGRQATNRASLTPGQRRQGESIPPCPPPPPARDTPSPPPGFSQIQFEESSGGFGGLFQESPGVSPYLRIPVSSYPTKNAWLLPGGSSHAKGITFPVRPGSSGRTRYWRT